MSEIDIDAVRNDTPGCAEVIHLNNAGSALPPGSVVSAMIDYLEAESRTGGYEVAAARREDLDRVYDAGALLLGCAPGELAFQPNGTSAWNAALATVDLAEGDRVLVTTAEYISNVFGLARLRQRGVAVELIPEDAHGQVSLDDLESLLDDRVKLVCATHVPTSGGVINPVKDMGQIVADSSALFLVDGTQSVGQMPIAVDEIGCDFLAVVGRKYLRGPRGTGLLYVRSGVPGLLDPPVLDGHSAEWTDDWVYETSTGARRYELFETSMAAKVGLGVAIEYALRLGVDAIAKRVSELSDSLRALLAASPLVRVVDQDGPQSGIVTFYVDGRSSEAVVAALRAWGINTSIVSPVPSAFDPNGRLQRSLVRASVHYYNTEEELVDAVAAL